MTNRNLCLTAVLLLAAPLGVACRTTRAAQPQIIQPGAPGQPSRVIDAERATDLSKVQFTAADVAFMQGMIGHHSQAVEMVELLKSRSASADMKLLAQRIEVSQSDEIGMMQHWLEGRGQPVPGPHAMHMHGATLMPGMLSAEQMAQLEAATGVAFDRLFLQFMIQHHNGALTMVEELFSTSAAGQESEIFSFASDVDADQRMEIARMSAMLKELQP